MSQMNLAWERVDGHGRPRALGLQRLRLAERDVDLPEAGSRPGHLDLVEAPGRVDDVLLRRCGGGQRGPVAALRTWGGAVMPRRCSTSFTTAAPPPPTAPTP